MSREIRPYDPLVMLVVWWLLAPVAANWFYSAARSNPAADDPTWEQEQSRIRSFTVFLRVMAVVACSVAALSLLLKRGA